MTSDVSPAPQRLHMQLESTFEELERMVDAVGAFLEGQGVDDDLAYRVVLLASEAVTNAIEHGNEHDRDKSVRLDIRLTKTSIDVAVEDEGCGFDPSQVSDPLNPTNLLQDSGRGLFLMKEMADDIRFERDGRLLRMVFHRSDDGVE